MRKKQPGSRRMQVTREENGLTLEKLLVNRLKQSRKHCKRLLDNRSVFINSRRTWMARHALREGDTVEVLLPQAATTEEKKRSINASIVFEDEHYQVINKPAGQLSTGPDSVEETMRKARPLLRCVHRLDRDTTGCLMLALSDEAFEKAVAIFRTRGVTKVYDALVVGEFTDRRKIVTAPVAGERAVSLVRCMQARERASHLVIRIETGRTHQVRLHLSGLGFPVLGDRKYLTGRQDDEAVRLVKRQMLHSSSLIFTHPFTGKTVRCHAALPGDFRSTMTRFGLRAMKVK